MFSRTINGFSFVEVIIVLAISAIIVTASYAWVLPRYAERTQQVALEQIQLQFYSARLMAFRFQEPLLICPQEANQKCGDDWSHAWRFWRGNEIVWTTQALPKNVRVTWQGVNKNSLMISASQQQAILAGRLSVAVNGATTKEIVLSRNGDARSIIRD